MTLSHHSTMLQCSRMVDSRPSSRLHALLFSASPVLVVLSADASSLPQPPLGWHFFNGSPSLTWNGTDFGHLDYIYSDNHFLGSPESCPRGFIGAVIFNNTAFSEMSMEAFPEQYSINDCYVGAFWKEDCHMGQIPRDYFNTTLGYHLVPGSYAWTYGAFYPINDTNRSSLRNWTIVSDQQIAEAVKKKKDVAYALIFFRDKLETLQALEGHMNLTLRGDCYEKEKNKLSQKCDASCEQNLSQSHFFCLAFENSVCNGYVTEKFFRIAHLTVPVVLRRAILKGIAPDSSFVAADDFSPPKELASYLLSVSANTTRYLEFFEWTKHFYRDMPENNRGVCDLCRDLHYRNVSSPWRNRSPNIQEYYSTEQCEEGVGEKLAQSQE